MQAFFFGYLAGAVEVSQPLLTVVFGAPVLDGITSLQLCFYHSGWGNVMRALAIV